MVWKPVDIGTHAGQGASESAELISHGGYFGGLASECGLTNLHPSIHVRQKKTEEGLQS